MTRPIAEVNAGDFHFELHKEDGKHRVLRSDISDPAHILEEVTDLQDIPPTVFNIFNELMY